MAEYEKCVFCQENIDIDCEIFECSNIIKSHKFHKGCVSSWIYDYNKFNCPTCRLDLSVDIDKLIKKYYEIHLVNIQNLVKYDRVLLLKNYIEKSLRKYPKKFHQYIILNISNDLRFNLTYYIKNFKKINERKIMTVFISVTVICVKIYECYNNIHK